MEHEILVAFSGEGSGSGELTWGQRNIWKMMLDLEDPVMVGGAMRARGRHDPGASQASALLHRQPAPLAAHPDPGAARRFARAGPGRLRRGRPAGGRRRRRRGPGRGRRGRAGPVRAHALRRRAGVAGPDGRRPPPRRADPLRGPVPAHRHRRLRVRGAGRRPGQPGPGDRRPAGPALGHPAAGPRAAPGDARRAAAGRRLDPVLGAAAARGAHAAVQRPVPGAGAALVGRHVRLARGAAGRRPRSRRGPGCTAAPSCWPRTR